jgi:hypothetical protein
LADLEKTQDGNTRRVGDTYYGNDPPERPFGVGARFRKQGDPQTYILGSDGTWQTESWQTFEVATQAPSGGPGSFFSAVEAVPMSINYGIEFDYPIVIREIHLRVNGAYAGTASVAILSDTSILLNDTISTLPFNEEVSVTVPANTNISIAIVCSASFPSYNASFLWSRTL